MAITDNAPKASFRLGMLLYDARYRSITIQILFLIALMLGLGWLASNAVVNLDKMGYVPSFSFLTQRAGYDISFKLIDYTHDDTHFRALLVGLVNTLFISALGCITATIIGVTAGVLRLSKNWVIARLMTLYVEIFRNVPLLLWLLVIFAILTEATPAPNAFRGANPAAHMWLWHSVAVTNRYVALPAPLFSRSLGSVQTDMLTLVAVIIASLLVNRFVVHRASAVQYATGVRPTTWWKSLLILFVPAIALLVMLGFHFEYPVLKGFNFSGGIQAPNFVFALWLGLSIYTGTYIAEIVRSGILAVSRGQSEAAYALGLRPGRTMSLVVLPQALRVIVPPMISQFLNLTKNSTLAAAISYPDLTATLGGITLNQTGRALECVLLMMMIYLIISLLISLAMNLFNRSVSLKER